MKKTAITNIFVLLICITVSLVCVIAINAIVKEEPLVFFFDDFKSFFMRLNENFIFYPIGLVLGLFVRINGRSYLIGIIQLTWLIYSLIRPLHSAANINSRMIRLASAEANKIEQEYASIDMPNKENYINMRKMEIYRRYGINPALNMALPLVDFFAFFVVFTVLCRFPYTAELNNGVDAKIFALDLFEGAQGGFEYLAALFVLGAVYFLLEFNMDKINISTDEMCDVISRRKDSVIYKIRRMAPRSGTGFGIAMVLIDFMDDLLLLDIWIADAAWILTLITFAGWAISEIVNVVFPLIEWILLKIKALRIRSEKAKQCGEIDNKHSSKMLEENSMTATKIILFLAGAGLILTNSLGVAVFMIAYSLYNMISHMEEQIRMIHYVQDRLDEDRSSGDVEHSEN